MNFSVSFWVEWWLKGSAVYWGAIGIGYLIMRLMIYRLTHQ